MIFSFTTVLASDLVLTIHNTRENQGQVLVSLFDSAENFLRKPLLAKKVEVGASGPVQITFSDLPPGDYALALVYDLNANGKLDTGLFRIPKEPIAFSNDAKGRFGPPSFEKCVFRHGEERQEISLHLEKVKK